MAKKIFKIIILAILITSLFVPLISAESKFTPGIDVRGETNQSLVLRFRDSETNAVIRSIVLAIFNTGRATTNIETNIDEVNVDVVFIKNTSLFLAPANIIKTKTFGPFLTSKVISIDVRDSTLKALELLEELNKTQKETAQPAQTPQPPAENKTLTLSEEKSVTGFSISSIFKTITNSTVTYIVLGVILVAGILFFFIFKKPGFSIPGISESPVGYGKSLVVVKGDDRKRLTEIERKVEKVEESLRQVISDIHKVRSRGEEISQAEKQYKEAQERLMKLKKGLN